MERRELEGKQRQEIQDKNRMQTRCWEKKHEQEEC